MKLNKLQPNHKCQGGGYTLTAILKVTASLKSSSGFFFSNIHFPKTASSVFRLLLKNERGFW